MNLEDYRPTDFRWSQRDPRWAKKKLGTSGLMVGGFGCAAVAVNYIVNRAWLKARIDRLSRPGEFIDWCNTYNKFTNTGAIYWNAADSFSAGLVKHTYNKTGSQYTLQEVVWGTYRHWLILLASDLCLDPWDGKIKKRKQPMWYPSGRYRYFMYLGK